MNLQQEGKGAGRNEHLMLFSPSLTDREFCKLNSKKNIPVDDHVFVSPPPPRGFPPHSSSPSCTHSVALTLISPFGSERP